MRTPMGPERDKKTSRKATKAMQTPRRPRGDKRTPDTAIEDR